MLLSEAYQSGIYWAVINAEAARERAANAEETYWIERAKKDGLVASVESSSRKTGTVDVGIRTQQQADESENEIAIRRMREGHSRLFIGERPAEGRSE